MHAELASGSTYDGKTFLIPKTADTVQSFINPRYMNFFTFAAYTTITINFLLAFVVKVPIAVSICIFFFWRAVYNGGLGYLLNIQSKHHKLTELYIRYTKDPSTPLAKFLVGIAARAIPDGYTTDSFPPAFNAWLVRSPPVSTQNVYITTKMSLYSNVTSE